MTLSDDPWNAFVAEAEAALAGDVPLTPYHALWAYHAQVCNGGHHQYFQNLHDAPDQWRLAVEGARRVGADEVAANLAAAIALHDSKPRRRFKNAVEFLTSAREGEFDEIDDRFYELESDLQRALMAAMTERKDS